MTRAFILSLALTCVATSAVHAEEDGRHKDRVTFNRLARQIRTARGKLAKAEEKALTHARQNNGEVPDPLKAKILSLQDEIDRNKNRIDLVALRHGWEIPDFEAEPAAYAKNLANSRAEVFGAADRLIKGALRTEAYDIAAGVVLPVVSVQFGR